MIPHRTPAIGATNEESKWMKVGGLEKVSRQFWYATGGFANSNYFRKMKSGCWHYFIDWRY
jgi:hypothetical protein